MRKLKVNESSIIYVACPANAATGGIELLHQLVYELNKLGLMAFMYYYEKKDNNPIHESYINYGNPYVDIIEDNINNIFIIPEIKTNFIYDFKEIQKVIWWMSVDNYYKQFNSNILLKKIIKQLLYKIGYYRVYRFEKNDNIFHFVQSEYAKQHLIAKNQKNIYFLGDYLNDLFIKQQSENMRKKKDDIVVYNPKKGIEFTQKIISQAKDIKFVPLENMTREEVASLLFRAKVYIDFGKHPGKDRIPREAAISGCCVITGMKGSAKYYEDVPIEKEFKFDDNIKNIPSILEKIQICFKEYHNEIIKFDFYRKKIKKEHDNFINDIKHIFIRK